MDLMTSDRRRLGVLTPIASGLALVALLFATGSAAASSCSITWTGNAGNDMWSEAANWSSERLPDASDHVCIPAFSTAEIMQNVGSISTLEGEGTLSMWPGSELQLTDSAQRSSVVDLNQAGGQLGGDGSLLVTGSFNWTGGEQTQAATTEIASGATLTMKSGVDSLGFGRTLQIDSGGSASMGSTSRLTIGEEAQVVDAGGFTVHGNKESYEGIVSEGLGGSFDNTASGTFTLSGSGTLPVGVPFEDQGTVDIGSGTLDLTAGGTETGSFESAGSESLLDFAAGTFTLASGLSLSGHIAQTGGQIKGPLDVKDTFEWAGGEQTEAATTEIAPGGTLEIHYGAATLRKGRTLQIDSGATATVTSRGQLQVEEGSQVANAGYFTVEESEGYEEITSQNTSGAFRNTAGGTFTLTGYGTFPFATAFDNEGTVDVSSGSLDLTAGGTETGTFDSAGSESLLDFAAGAFTLASSLNLNGHIAQTGGQLKGPLDVKNTFEWTGGEQTEPATTEVAPGGTLEIQYGTATLRKGRILQVDSGATAVMTSRGRLAMGENARVENKGDFEADDDEEGYEGITGEAAGSTFHNTATGIFTRSGDGSFPVSATLINEGTIEVATGVLAVWNLTQTSHGVLSVHLRGSLLGVGFTQVDIEHSSSIAGRLRVATEDGFHPEPSQHFKILDASGLVGRFDAVEEIGAIGGGWSYTVVYGEAGAELVVAGGPVPTTTSASISGGGQTGTSITLPEDSVVSASANLSGAGASSANGSMSYRVYSDSECHDEVANAGTVPVTAGVVPGSSQEAFPPGIYYWQASYSGDTTN
ncbi:MAG TPA: hypothetical protein VKU44_02960, partial [Terriglobia bacterium]|nr:hypothetical protein [Terriglobia bacterium]